MRQALKDSPESRVPSPEFTTQQQGLPRHRRGLPRSSAVPPRSERGKSPASLVLSRKGRSRKEGGVTVRPSFAGNNQLGALVGRR